MTDVVEKDQSTLQRRFPSEPLSRACTGRKLVVLTSRQPDMQAIAREGHSGGLVAALAPVLERTSGTWIAGRPLKAEDAHRAHVKAPADAPWRNVGVRYPATLHKGYYTRLANGVLWPLYHGFIQEATRCRSADWEDYELVNRHFAAVAADQVGPDSFVWVHDYQLSLVPAMLREKGLNNLSLGFFLHTPFPSYDTFRVLPWARDVLLGMLGADLIGFHTEDYRRNFVDCVRRLLGLECAADAAEICIDGRRVKLRAIPVGIDTQGIYQLLQDPWVRHTAARLKEKVGGERLLLGVDRMDYTKGINRRMEAVDLLLEQHPQWRGRVVFAQIAVPSRAEVSGYAALRRQLERLSGNINGRWGREDWSPVKLLCRSYPLRELVAWYLAADVALVTPYRDGMNLVAKEFCAANLNSDGVLVLSEFAGAADELGDALLVNPFDLESLTETIHRALQMPAGEARSRMQRLNQRIQSCDAHYWVEAFLTEAGWHSRVSSRAGGVDRDRGR